MSAGRNEMRAGGGSMGTPATPRRADAWALLCEWTAGREPAPPRPGRRGRRRLVRRSTVSASPGAELETLAHRRPAPRLRLRALPRHPPASAAPRSCAGWATPRSVVEAVLGHGDHTGVPRTTYLAQHRLRLRRDERLRHRRGTRAAEPQPRRGRCAVGAQEDEGQGLRAAGAARPARRRAPTELGVPFDEHVSNVIEGLKTVRGELGL